MTIEYHKLVEYLDLTKVDVKSPADIMKYIASINIKVNEMIAQGNKIADELNKEKKDD